MLIERYIITEIARSFAVGLAILCAVFVAFSAAVKLSDAATGAAGIAVIAQLVLLSLLATLEVLVPTTLYLAILFVIGRMHRDSEMIALAAAGVGEGRLLGGVLRIALVAALLVGLVSVFGRPWSYARSYALEQESMRRFDLGNIRPGSFVDLVEGGYVLHAREVDAELDRLRHVFLQLERPHRSQVITARSARIVGPDADGRRSLEFFDGHAYLLDRRGTRDVDMRFNRLLVHFPEEEKISRFRRKALDTATLGASAQPKDIAEYQWRISTPLATVLLALLAVPLGRANPRQSRISTLVVALLAYVLLFAAVGFVRGALENGDLPGVPGLFTAYLPALALLLALTVRPRRATARRSAA